MIVVVVVIMIVVMIIVIVMMVVVMLTGVFAMELASAFIMPMNPFMMMSGPMSRHPYPEIAIIPIARTLGVIGAIADLDRDPERHHTGPGNQANRQESYCKNREFCFHNRF